MQAQALAPTQNDPTDPNWKPKVGKFQLYNSDPTISGVGKHVQDNLPQLSVNELKALAKSVRVYVPQSPEPTRDLLIALLRRNQVNELSYKLGEVVASHLNLARRWPEKFRRVADNIKPSPGTPTTRLDITDQIDDFDEGFELEDDPSMASAITSAPVFDLTTPDEPPDEPPALRDTKATQPPQKQLKTDKR